MLTPIEERVSNIIGRDVGPMPNVRQDQFSSNVGGGVNLCETIIEQQAGRDDATNDSPSVIVLQVNDGIEEHEILQSPSPSHSGHTPPTHSLSGTPRRRNSVQARRLVRQQARTERALRRPTVQPPAQSGRSALDELRTMIIRIEQIRAEAALKMAEAAKLVAESIDRFFTQKYCREP